MAKQKVTTKEEEKVVETTEKPKRLGMTLEELQAQLKEKEKLRVVLETEYYKINGQIQLLIQQIATLTEK